MAPFTTTTGDGIRIAGDLFMAHGSSRGTLVLAHGLPSGAAPPSDTTDEGYPGLARRLAQRGFSVAIFNFRGTGMSGGHLMIDRWADDLGAVLDYLDRSEAKRKRYAVIGFSAGGAASIMRSALDERIDPLITMAAPADYSFLPINTDAEAWYAWYREMGMIRDGYGENPQQWAQRFREVNAREAIARSKAEEIFVIHGTADDTVPVTHANILAKAAGDKARSILIAGGIHQMRRDERAVDTLFDVLQRVFP
ncbi:MAG TPA: alpha/beta fold hydrolase [bacterium]|nr:alpha/beta fold hydrolase [bacterium]